MNSKKEDKTMAVMTRPVKKVMVTSETEAARMAKSADPKLMAQIKKNAERVNKQFVDKRK